jgi:hypothetical protein
MEPSLSVDVATLDDRHRRALAFSTYAKNGCRCSVRRSPRLIAAI